MQNRYIPADENLKKLIKEICDNHCLGLLQEAKLDTKQIESLGQAALKEWETVLPKNRNFLTRLFAKPWNSEDTRYYSEIKSQLCQIKDGLSLKNFYEFTKTLEANSSPLKENINTLMQFFNRLVGEKIPFFSDKMDIYKTNLNYSIKRFVETYFLTHREFIQQKRAELSIKSNQSDAEMNFIKIVNSAGGYTAWERLDAYFKLDSKLQQDFFDDLITQLKLHFMPRKESHFTPFKSMG